MKRLVSLTLAFVFVLAQLSYVGAQGQAVGIISGTATGTNGAALAGVTVQVVNSAGTVVGSAVTTAAGSFSVGGLTAGTFTVNVVAASGAVIGTSTATLTAAAMTATVGVSATAAAAAAAAGAAAAGGAAAAAGGISTAAHVAGVGAAAAGIGAAAVVANRDDASPSR